MIRVQPISSWRYPSSPHRLDSASKAGSPYSRWSYRMGPATRVVRCDAATYRTTLHDQGHLVREWSDPLSALGWLETQLTEPPTDGPPFKGGWLGFISYEAGRLFEPGAFRSTSVASVPLFSFRWHPSIDACDAGGQRYAVDLGDEPSAPVAKEAEHQPLNPVHLIEPLGSTFTPDEYRTAVTRVIDYIRAGDVFQVNLSQRFTAGLRGRQPQDIYRSLLDRFPAWHGAYLDLGEAVLLSNSPELFLRVTPGPDGRQLLTRPIKGTRPLATGMREVLHDSVKDQAELNMIIDLERNDLGRICEVGSVRVTEPRAIEAHPTVYHGAATVSGRLRRDVGFVDLLRATFPGGSVTGAPKIRAMQIIEELEPMPRGVYCGAIGYLSVDGHMQFNLPIRTMTVEQSGRAHIPVGGGIVADSDPESEYRETLVKARAMFESLGISI